MSHINVLQSAQDTQDQRSYLDISDKNSHLFVEQPANSEFSNDDISESSSHFIDQKFLKDDNTKTSQT
jgi:hypothetical protein